MIEEMIFDFNLILNFKKCIKIKKILEIQTLKKKTIQRGNKHLAYLVNSNFIKSYEIYS